MPYADPARRLAYPKEWARKNRARSNAIKRRWVERNRELNAQFKREWHKKSVAISRSTCRAYQAAKRRAVPAWANKEKMQAIYKDAAARGLEVDHIVPLISSLVCGLHWEGNLQAITRAENVAKGNKWWPDMPI